MRNPLIAPLVAAALAASLVAPGVVLGGHQTGDPVDRGLDWLRARQGPDGSIAGKADASAWAAIALARAGGADCAAVRLPGGASLLDFVVAETRPGLSLLGLQRQVLALAACGADPRTAAGFDAVQAILDAFDGQQLGSPLLLNDDIFGLQALAAAGVPPGAEAVAKTRAFLVRNQQPSGAWGFTALGPHPEVLFGVLFADVDLTGQALAALRASAPAEPDPAGDQAEARGLLFLKVGQWLDGGCQWSPLAPAVHAAFGALGDPVGTVTRPQGAFGSNADSTSWAAMGVLAAGHDPDGPLWAAPGGPTLADFLEGLQGPSGQFAWMPGEPGFGPEATTAWAVLALSGHTFAA